MPLNNDQKERLTQVFKRFLKPEELEEFFNRLQDQPEEALAHMNLSAADVEAFRDHLSPFNLILNEPSDAQKKRLVLAFGQLLEPDNLQTFMTTWKQDPNAALALLGLDRADLRALERYTRSFDPRRPVPFPFADCVGPIHVLPPEEPFRLGDSQRIIDR